MAASGNLGANPVEAITHNTGEWGLRFLLLTLAVTPVRLLTGYNALVRVRRMLGLFAFFYIVLHLGTYIWLDAYFDLVYILDDVLERTYITVGFATFIILCALAATSTDKMVRRLGGKNWRRLHRMAYAAGLGGVLHFLWLVKADYREPAVYAGILALLLVLRMPPVSGALLKLKTRLRRPRGTSTGISQI